MSIISPQALNSPIIPKTLLRITPHKLYKKYTNINNKTYRNELGDLLSCLQEYNFDYKIFNKLIFNLDLYVLKNLYRYVWIRFKLLKIHMKEHLSQYEDDETYKYITEFNMQYYKDFYKNEDLLKNYYNFVYNNLYTTNKTLCIFIYNTIAQYLVF